MLPEFCLSSAELWNVVVHRQVDQRTERHLEVCEFCRLQVSRMEEDIDRFIVLEDLAFPEPGREPGSLTDQDFWNALQTTTRIGSEGTRRNAVSSQGEESALGRYRLLERIHDGQEATLYRGWDPDTARMVAIKVLKSHSAGVSPEWSDEASILSQLQHPHLVQIHDRGYAGGQGYMVMEWLEGSTLRQLAAVEQIDVPMIVEILSQLADVVGYLHRHGFVHLDLKPENVMVLSGTAASWIKLIDYGLVWNYGRRPFPKGVVAGTPGFMSPEQEQGDSACWGPPSDVFGLGAILKFLLSTLSKEAPLTTSRNSVPARLNLRGKPCHASAIQKELHRICQRAMQDSPSNRHQNAMEFGRAIRAACQKEASGITWVSRWGLCLLTATLISLVGPAAAYRSTRLAAIDDTIQRAEPGPQAVSHVVELRAHLSKAPDSALWLWSQGSGAVLWKGPALELPDGARIYSSGVRGLELSSSIGPLVLLLAMDPASHLAPNVMLQSLGDRVNQLGSPWPQGASVRLTPRGLLPEGFNLSCEERRRLEDCRTFLNRHCHQYDAVLVSLEKKDVGLGRFRVDLTLENSERDISLR